MALNLKLQLPLKAIFANNCDFLLSVYRKMGQVPRLFDEPQRESLLGFAREAALTNLFDMVVEFDPLDSHSTLLSERYSFPH